MAQDIRIVNTELQWKDWNGNVRSREGDLLPNGSGTEWDNRVPGSIYIPGTLEYLAYIDRSASANRRKIQGVQVGETGDVPAGEPPVRSLYSYAEGLRYIPDTRDFFGPKPIYEILDGDPPEDQPQSLSISWGIGVFFPPYDARLTWSNPSPVDWDTIEVRFYQNNALVEERNTSNTGATSMTTLGEYWEIGDEIKARIWYTNDYGAGPVSEIIDTVS